MILVAMLVLGAVAGYASLALGPVGWVLVSTLSILVVVSFRRRPLAQGAYLLLLGATGAAILMPLVIGRQACSVDSSGAVVVSCHGSQVCAGACYAPSTLPTVLVYLAVLLLGLIFATYAIGSRYARSSAS